MSGCVFGGDDAVSESLDELFTFYSPPPPDDLFLRTGNRERKKIEGTERMKEKFNTNPSKDEMIAHICSNLLPARI